MDAQVHNHRVNIEDVRWRATNKLIPRLQRTVVRHHARKHVQQAEEKSSHTTELVKTTNSSKPRQSKMALRYLLKKNQITPSDSFSLQLLTTTDKPSPSVKYKSKQSVSEVTVNKLQSSRPPLFISDQPVVVRGVSHWVEAGRTQNEQEKRQSEAGFARHAFNQYASDRLGYFREIPDTRHTL